MTEKTVDKKKLQKCVLDTLENADLATITLKQMIKEVETALDLEKGTLKSSPDLKSFVKSIVLEETSKSINCESSKVTKKEKALKSHKKLKKLRKRKMDEVSNSTNGSSKKPKKVSKEPVSKLDKHLKQLNLMQRASGIGPAVYKNLSDDKADRVQELSKRLKEMGAVFSGSIPTDKEIRAAKAVYDKKKELEGIDVSNIIDSTSGRRTRKRPRVQYHKDDPDSSEEEDEGDKAEGEDDQDDDEEVASSDDASGSVSEHDSNNGSESDNDKGEEEEEEEFV